MARIIVGYRLLQQLRATPFERITIERLCGKIVKVIFRDETARPYITVDVSDDPRGQRMAASFEDFATHGDVLFGKQLGTFITAIIEGA